MDSSSSLILSDSIEVVEMVVVEMVVVREPGLKDRGLKVAVIFKARWIRWPYLLVAARWRIGLFQPCND